MICTYLIKRRFRSFFYNLDKVDMINLSRLVVSQIISPTGLFERVPLFHEDMGVDYLKRCVFGKSFMLEL